jgi:sec-independent protein translocase protein TatC
MGIFVFAAVMTPTPDAITMIIMAAPMCALYFGAVGVGALRERAKAKKSP